MRCLFCAVSILSLTACSVAQVPPGITEPALLSAQSAVSAQQESSECLSGASKTAVQILRVTDGDTVVLADQRRIRIIGLNTLEMNSPEPADRHFATAASQALETLLAVQPVYLITGREEFDRYGRTLAHIQLADGRIAAQSLIHQGLAIAVAVGKNTRCAIDFLETEQNARNQQRGIWKQPGQWLDGNARLAPQSRGFRLVQSAVREITGHNRQRQLRLENGLIVKPGKYWPTDSQGNALQAARLLGKRIEVRGWIGSSGGNASMSVHHSAYLTVLDNP